MARLEVGRILNINPLNFSLNARLGRFWLNLHQFFDVMLDVRMSTCIDRLIFEAAAKQLFQFDEKISAVAC